MICLIRRCRRSTSESIEPLGGIVITNPNVRPVRHARQWIKKSLRQILRENQPLTSTLCTAEPATGSPTRKSNQIPGTDHGWPAPAERMGLWTIHHGSCASSAAAPQIPCLPWFRTAPETSPPRCARCAQREPCRSVTNQTLAPTYPSSGTSCPGHVPRNQPLSIRRGNTRRPDSESG